MATLATDEQGPFLKSGGFLEKDHHNSSESLVASLGTESGSKPTVATLATDEQGTFKNRRLFWCWLLCLVLVIM